MSHKQPFMSGCPYPGCPKQNKIIRWKHPNCGGSKLIYDDGYVQCDKCHAKAKLSKNSFTCDYHKGEYGKMSMQDIFRALSMSSMMNNWDRSFTQRLMASVRDMLDD